MGDMARTGAATDLEAGERYEMEEVEFVYGKDAQ
jgi:hypothetical protein